MKTIYFAVLLIVCLPLFGAAQTSDEAAKLISETLKNKSGGELTDYYFKLTAVYTRAKKGKPFNESEVFEIFLPSTMPATRTRMPLIQIAANGAPLSDKKINVQRLKAAEQIEKIERDAEQNRSVERVVYFTASVQFATLFDVQSITFNPLSVLENSTFSDLRRERINSRETIALDFRTADGAAFDNSESYLKNVAGTIWIDAADKKIVRVTGFPADKFAAHKTKNELERETESVVFYEQTRVGDNTWLPLRIHFKNLKYPNFFNKQLVDVQYLFSGFQRFRVEVERKQ